jgi:hypothetical protein
MGNNDLNTVFKIPFKIMFHSSLSTVCFRNYLKRIQFFKVRFAFLLPADNRRFLPVRTTEDITARAEAFGIFFLIGHGKSNAPIINAGDSFSVSASKTP